MPGKRAEAGQERGDNLRTLFHVAAREIKERRSVLAAAAVAGVFPFLVALLPQFQSSAAALRGNTAFLTTSIFGLGLGLMLGDSILARELVEGRIGFYFSRPLPAVSIWGGKLLAAFLLTAAAIALCLLPVAIADNVHLGGVLKTFDVLTLGGVLILATTSLALVLHAITIALRTRSLWLAVDLALLVLTTAALVSAYSIVLDLAVSSNGFGAERTLKKLLASVVWTALVAASFAQVVFGRTDTRRAHAALSLTFWSIVAPALGVLHGYVLYCRDAPLGSLSSVRVAQAAAQGSWVRVTGHISRGGYSSSFLVDSESGHWLGVGATKGFAFSSDGHRAAWIRITGSIGRGEIQDLFLADLTTESPVAARSTIPIRTWWPTIALSADGSRLAVLEAQMISVYALPEERLLASTQMPVSTSGEPEIPFFLSNDDVRVVFRRHLATSASGTTRMVSIFDVDVPRMSLRPIPPIESPFGGPLPQVVPLEGRQEFILVEGKGERITLHDAQGGLLSTLYTSEGKNREVHSLLVLADGKIVLGETADVGMRLLSYSSSGKSLSTLQIAGYRSPRLVAEAEQGRLILTAQPVGSASGGPILLGLDLTSGAVRSIASGVTSVKYSSSWTPSTLRPVSSRDTRARLFLTNGDVLVKIDLDTGTRKVIAGPGA